MDGAEFEFRLADVGEGLHEAEIKRWLVQVGDRVTLDQPLVEIETDKAVVELPSPVTGVVTRLGAAEGEILNVGELVALIDPEHDAATAPAPPTAAISGHTPAAAQLTQSAVLDPQSSTRRTLATPAVRKLARDLGVDLAQVPGSGPGGRVIAADVEGFARSGVNGRGAASGALASEPPVEAPLAAPRPAAPRSAVPASDITTLAQPPPVDSRLPLRGLRRRIAQTMTQGGRRSHTSRALTRSRSRGWWRRASACDRRRRHAAHGSRTCRSSSRR